MATLKIIISIAAKAQTTAVMTLIMITRSFSRQIGAIFLSLRSTRKLNTARTCGYYFVPELRAGNAGSRAGQARERGPRAQKYTC